MNRVSASTRRQRKPGIIRRDRLNCVIRHIPFQLASVTKLCAATDRQNTSGNKARFGRKEKNCRVSDDVSVRAITEEVDAVEVLPYMFGIRLIGRPLL